MKESNDDYIDLASLVNKQCENLQLGTLTADQFKCLIFVCGLTSPEDADVRTRALSTIEMN